MKDEPVLKDGAKQLIVTAIAWLAAKYVPGLDLDAAQVNAFALSVLGVATVAWGVLTRAKVVPMKTAEAKLAAEHPAALAALKRPT